ncbi:hypothetical protein jhhlp_003363 [Lomentospora prolificans]|uniref:Ubiquitin-protein ligase n=1 Tax=Lomentospora prolificans TaxID=41688 RepID=A0A2N3NGP6_9PEZI|nr:hypothetical protein jhhlp_003363 [Lomentospora prolificans]
MDEFTHHVPSASDTPGIWHNFTTWTAQHFKSTVNATKYAPSLEDIVWAGPRIVRRLGSIIFLPEGGGAFASGSTSEPVLEASVGHSSTIALNSAPSGIGPGGSTLGSSTMASATPAVGTDGAKGLSSVFSYATSKWALCCIAMAIILNRAYIFAATRRRLSLPWHVRILIRGAPVVLLTLQARQLLQSIQCQTSPEFSAMRWGNSSKHSDLMFSETNAFLHGLSSTFLLNRSDMESCTQIRMIPSTNVDPEVEPLKGSLSLLWPLFGTFCLSQLLETIVCAVEGRPLAAETGMTLFEHSLAFAEADAAISSQLGWGSFSPTISKAASTPLESTMAISRSMILRRVNTSPEVLFVAFLSSMAHITSHVLGMFNLQAKFRLLSTTFWGLCFMGSILWSVVTFSVDSLDTQSLLRFPTVCIIGFVPHILVLAGILVCLSIYGFALLLSTIAPPQGRDVRPSGFLQRLIQAQGNLQANISLSDLRISREMDFYTALLRTGFGAITLASEAVYLNEDSAVSTPRHTWLDDQRFRELESFQARSDAATTAFSVNDQPGSSQHPLQRLPLNGYSREKSTQSGHNQRDRLDRYPANGVGAAVRSGRWLVALDFVLNIYRVLVKTWALIFIKLLEKIGVGSRPSWLLWLFQGRKATRSQPGAQPDTRSLASPPYTIDGVWIPRGDQVDVEAEVRKRLQTTTSNCQGISEEDLDSRLYSWWLAGGIWGSVDNSGEYISNEQESVSDNASVLSIGTSDEEDSEPEFGGGSGQTTPTQLGAPPLRDTSIPFDSPIQVADLARLLQPRTLEDQEEADALSAHLSKFGVSGPPVFLPQAYLE